MSGFGSRPGISTAAEAQVLTNLSSLVTTSSGFAIAKNSDGTFSNVSIGSSGSGAITPTTVNGLTISLSTGTLTIANGKTFSVSNSLTFTGTDASSIAFGSGGTIGSVGYASTGQIPGTTTNDNASAGKVGELITATVASGSPVSLSTTATANVTSISLTAGDWEVSGIVDYAFGGATSVSYLAQGISTTSATLGTQDTFSALAVAAMVPSAAKDMALNTAPVRITVASGTTTVYLVAQGIFSISTLGAYGSLRARRVR